MTILNEADYVCPYMEALDTYANMVIQRLSKDELWAIAARRPLLRRDELVAAVDQYNTIYVFGGPFETRNVNNEPVSARPLSLDSMGRWCVAEEDELDFSWLGPSYNWKGVEYYPELLLRSVQEIDTPRQALSPYPQGFQCPLWITYKPLEVFREHDSCESKHGHFRGLSRKWREKTAITQYLSRKMIATDTVRRIDKVMCFGLGTLETDRSFLLHKLAAMIPQAIEKKQGSRPKIGVCNQGYCEASLSLIKNVFTLGIHDRLTALLLVDKHTFVICMDPPEAISQFVVDICHNEGGPAALLNRGVHNDGKWVVQGLEGEHMSTSDQDYSSPLLYAWANECIADGRHISVEDRFEDGEEHNELACLGQGGAELYWSKNNGV